ncbi:MAG: T9SS type A sorting domain-containing protein [Flavobacteriales bacterium]|tara:strand:+ start:2800 stop:3063 length:264 start_codon:yes stop_codon:yes gene_type:complete
MVRLPCPKHLIIYPNPSSGLVSVMYSSRNANSIIISDNMGKTIFTQKLRSPQNEILLDISNYSSGLYRVSILNKSGEILMSKKLVKY